MKTLTVFTRKDFRNWLKKYHDTETKAGVILYKKHTGKPAPSHRELIEEAICFGWIDTTVKRLDEERYLRTFSRRTKNSTWSDNTLRYAKDLIAAGKMTPFGLQFYEQGLKKPTHDAGIPKNPKMPLELQKALAKDKIANANFATYSPSVKRMFYRWILSGKREETRIRRIKVIVTKARVGAKHI